ncbi:guanylate-binding protein 7-like isoform X2 [Podarcis muralis]
MDSPRPPSVNMEEPMCLIENNPNEQLRVNQEALKILQSIQQPVVVVAIVGLYRTGKSYLMNKLAGKKKGFSLGATIQAETMGIWMWCLPHPENPGHTLVLLDTEGLGDVEKSNIENDAWIFALSILLSSTLVYNSMGIIDQFALEKLQYVTELTKRIKVKATATKTSEDGEEESSDDFLRFFPAFVWAVRDFTLQLKLNGCPISSDKYLENALRRKKVLGHLVVTYVDTISSGSIPCIENAVVALAQIENTAAVHDAITYYEGEIEKHLKLPTETIEELLKVHAQYEKEAIKVFLARAFKDDNHDYQKELGERLQSKLSELCSRNEQASLDRCQAVLLELFQDLEENFGKGTYSVAGGYLKFLDHQKEKLEQYHLLPGKGIMASKALEEFLNSKEAAAQSILQADRTLTEKEEELEVERVRAEASAREAKRHEQMKEEAIKMAQEKERSYKEHEAQLMAKMEEDRKKMQAEHEMVMNRKLEEQRRLQKEGFEQEVAKLQLQIQALQKTVEKPPRHHRCVIQ